MPQLSLSDFCNAPGDTWLLYADLHLHEWPDCSRVVDGMNSRLAAGLSVLAEIKDIAKEYQVQRVFNLGDTIHAGQTRIPAAVAYHGFRALAELHEAECFQESTIIVGNHDQPKRRSVEENVIEAVGWWRNTELVAQQTRGRSGGLLPYFRTPELFLAALQSLGSVPVIFCHQGFKGAGIGPEGDYFLGDGEVDPEALIAYGVKQVFTGHYHRHQTFTTATGTEVVYVGAPMQHTFGDRGSPSGVVLYKPGNRVWTQVLTTAPKFHKIEVSSVKEVSFVPNVVTERDYVWIVIAPGAKLTPAKVQEILDERCAFLRVDDLRKSPPVSSRSVLAVSTVEPDEVIRGFLKNYQRKYTELDPEQLEKMALSYHAIGRSTA